MTRLPSALRRAVLVAVLWSGLGVAMALSLPAPDEGREPSPATVVRVASHPGR